MQEAQAYIGDRSGSQWSENELAKLREIAPRMMLKSELLAMFPDRSINAIKMKLSVVRKEMGEARGTDVERMHSTPMLDPGDEGLLCDYPKRWASQAAASNARFLAALGVAA